MSASMHENIAQALREADDHEVPGSLGTYPELATAALEAAATPTPAMLDAGRRAATDHLSTIRYAGEGLVRAECQQWDWNFTAAPGPLVHGEISGHQAAAVWAAMVAAAGEAS